MRFLVDLRKRFNTVTADDEPTGADPHDPNVRAWDSVGVACNVTVVFEDDLVHNTLLLLAIFLRLPLDLREPD